MLSEYVSNYGEVRVVHERVDERGVRVIVDRVDATRTATWDRAEKRWMKRRVLR